MLNKIIVGIMRFVRILRICMLPLIILAGNCNGSHPIMKHDSCLSVRMRNLPYLIGLISEVRIYKTTKNSFLSDSELANLTPIKMFTSNVDIDKIFETMANGRISSQDLVYKSLQYSNDTFHLIGVDPSGINYGYLKIRVSADRSRPLIAQVQPLNDTNSIELIKGLAEVLESARTEVIH